MKGFIALLLIAVLMFVGYTYQQVAGLRTEVDRLRDELARRPVVEVSESHGDVARLLGEAAESCRRARVALDRGETRKARREIGLCLEKLSKASAAAQRHGSGPDISRAWEQVKRQVDALWRQFAKNSKSE